jgi:hypothetical protein
MWTRPHALENRAAALAALALAVVLQWTLPAQFELLHPRWLIPVLELALVGVLVSMSQSAIPRHHPLGRWLGLTLVALLTGDNGLSAARLALSIARGHAGGAPALLATAAEIYLTNVIAFGVWYWEIDRGGPLDRARARRPHPDWLFPQMTARDLAPHDWRPTFVDYLYVSLTNATAFSPTDTLPLSIRAKALMGAQSLISYSLTALVLARAINILT